MTITKVPVMLWAEYKQEKALEVVLKEAAEYYQRKYGHKAVRCEINVKRFLEVAGPDVQELQVAGLTVTGCRSVLPSDHYISG